MRATAIAPARTRLQNVLFATDFSMAAEQAVPFIKKIATHYHSNLIALHVRPPVINLFAVPGISPTYAEALRAEDQQHRREILQTFADIPTQVFIEEGDIQTCLEKIIEDKNIDLLVIGTRGRTGISKLLMGSVAEEIFRTVSCPVLTVGPYSQPLPTTDQGEFRAVLCACDFTRASNEAAAYAVSLAQECQARLSLLHVIPEPEPGDLVSWSDIRESSEKLLRQIVPNAEPWCKPEYFVERGDPAERILDVAKVRQSDLIVLGAHLQEGVSGAATHLEIATAHKVVSYAKCPVLTIRD